jgi:hypothetical protein
MKLFRKNARYFALPLALAMAATSLPVNVAQAGLVSSETVMADRQTEADRARVAQFMSREDVRQAFGSYGVDAREANMRVAALSDAEISKLAATIDQDPAGQGFIGVVIFVGIVVLVVLLVTDAIGETDVF